ncbi:lipocalin family protein [Streptomyces sp. TRM75563]|uniref:lipocalin family protein n=1 Tax=Streptomyces sp. TRM75563 TaxID=2817418 RepID=UPI001F60073E|nr:lipocalin family protein [Streptomyces sp. TRM75563]MCI4042805.1 lipocalin family protein [Streptomyces sp. TRM75563]
MSVSSLTRRAAVVAVSSVLTLAGAAAADAQQVSRVDLGRYAGTWYQIAAVPQLFQIQCKKNVRAQYTPQSDGSVDVRNTCTTWWGSASVVNGAARPLDESNTRLNVSFTPRPGGGFVHGSDANYVVVGLAPDYSWAAVINEERSAGFLLSRTPALGSEASAAAIEAFTDAGVDPCDLRLTRQDGGVARPDSLCR